MRVDNKKAVFEDILKSRDVLSAITDGDLVANVSQGEAGKTLLTREDVKNECQTVKLDAAKVAVLFSNGASVPAQETKDIVDAFNHHIISLIYKVSMCLPGGGTQLQKQVQTAVKALGVAASNLLTGVVSIVSQEGPTPQLAALAEQVRTKADAVEKVPLDQRSAVCKSFAAAGISVQDVLRELNGLLEESQEAANATCMDIQNLSLTSTGPSTTTCTAVTSNESPVASSAVLDPVASIDTTHEVDGCPPAQGDPHSSDAAIQAAAPQQQGRVRQEESGDSSNEGDSDCILDFTPQDLKPEEARRVVAAASVLQHTFSIIKECMALALKLPAAVGRKEEVEHWDALAGFGTKLRDAADDLGCAMIPPHSEEEVAQSCNDLHSQAGEVLQQVAARADCAEIAAACKAMQSAVEVVRGYSSRLQPAPEQ